jgi:hypothetical protein
MFREFKIRKYKFRILNIVPLFTVATVEILTPAIVLVWDTFLTFANTLYQL